MTKEIKHLIDEDDIGSGETSQAQREIEEEIRKIPKTGETDAGADTEDRNHAKQK